ncbi:hypothetical protein SASPL_112237 [Salvia splendens]|uniref:Peptidase M24 domain-containing protein n=1 Tax=Salvia splendens TaxID=180675 RepID=A0A8X8YAV4_SALSN|nr:hypothetical protein SASPL_112237 [Salvia splendens]
MAGGSGSDAVSLSCARCAKPAHLQCPKCVQLKLPRKLLLSGSLSFLLLMPIVDGNPLSSSQDCFKASWTSHKSLHSNPISGNSTQQDLGWFYCLREGQARTPKLPHFDWTGPYPISPKRTVPTHIHQPDWAIDGIPKIEPNSDLQYVVEIAREVLDAASRIVRPGITTAEIDAVVHEATIAAGGYPSPLNYNFFPKSCCTSVNEVICHGIPDARKLEDGDIVNVDVSVYYKGLHGDLNETFFVGNVDEASKRLVQHTYECLDNAIAAGVWRDRMWPDGWANVTADGKLSAQFEHTLLVIFFSENLVYMNLSVLVVTPARLVYTNMQVTDTGVEVLTERLPSSPKVFPWLSP